jgi:TetR/AcrR family transcriptional regulator, transcriptional repressor for nem operon
MVIISAYAPSTFKGPLMESPPPSRKQITHDRILDTAARVLRDSGFQGVGVADIMNRAGLTHGGFYAHFPSRDALLAEALARAGQDSQARLQRSIAAGEAKAGNRFRALVESYLSERHLRSADSGCPVAALASEMPRQSEAVRAAAANRVESLVRAVQDTLPADQPPEAAAVVASQLVGGLQLARTLGDNAKGRRHLAAARHFLLEQFDRPGPSGH